ncbi:hypothetical protein [Desulfobacter postgatei]|uniref:hypothetical protein n=1 Tax=Desulfobacter postgatei TaxID=2293 RepID=UPI00259BDD6F|nr:hypothetical protein [uncultured Desulfobacter sp.]
MNWLFENKAWEWLFSGIGVVVGKIFKKRKEKNDHGHTGRDVSFVNKGDNIRISGNNVSFAKDHGKSTQIINAKVGVVGDHAEIKGDVNVK